MTGDELKSAEKRASDAALEKENMRVAMTATEMKAISTTCVYPAPDQIPAATDMIRHTIKTSCSIPCYTAYGWSVRSSLRWANLCHATSHSRCLLCSRILC